MFYQCPKCQKIWQYPIEKCPDCFLELEKRLSENLKVIAVSRVTIPTILHPKVPYFVLLLETDQGRKFVQKTIKEYKIGDEFKFKKAKDKSAVAIWRVKYDIFEAIEKIFELLGITPNQNFWWGAKILILPTLISPAHPYFAKNTNPEVLKNLIKFLIQKGVKREKILVAGQSFNDFPIEASAKKSKFLSVCQENKVQILDFSKTKFKKIKRGDSIFEISEEVFKRDLIINLPILKIDSKLGVRGALENLTKFLKKESFLGLKYLSSQGELILKLKGVLPEILTIADGIKIQKSNGFTAFFGLILASFNPLNLDRVFAEISTIELPEYLKSIKIKDIEIVGREIEEVQYNLEKI
ncbi:DUF362 domain-containing protein [Patescibacteria group bacterium]|nr:DUF362 domain-containing protein [Patescibacteria group bacterium]